MGCVGICGVGEVGVEVGVGDGEVEEEGDNLLQHN